MTTRNATASVSRTPSAIYRVIWKAIRQRQQIVLMYDKRPREACPIILGYAADGREVAFAFQFAGLTSEGGTLPAWRCLYLGKVSDLTARAGEWRQGESHRQAQRCVRHVDVDVNIPETLTRARPLPFGSPQLQPPRQT